MRVAVTLAMFALATIWVGADRGFAGDAVETALGSCWSCHGADTAPKDPTIPIIQGQQRGYLEKQLRDFRSGDRDSQIMSSMAEILRPDDIPHAAAIIAGKPWPNRMDAAAPQSMPEPVAVCKVCHGDGLMGGASPEGVAPRLAGQFAEYLDEQMSAFARGDRADAKTMTAQMKALSPKERSTVARYLAGL
jgi:cytochrome c553